MRRISKVFESLAAEHAGAYIPYICAGDSDTSFTIDLFRRLCDSGADIIEIGIPFSDPVGDGQAVQEAMARSLSSGFKVDQLFGALRAIREQGIDNPTVVMTYYNPVLRMGVEDFCGRLNDAGGDAILVVDMPIEESEELDDAARRNHLDVIRLITPMTDDKRLDLIVKKASGFLYAVSVAGVTGARDQLPPSAVSLIRRVVPKSSLPVVLGFGISHPEHVREAIGAGASGVVEGSALISRYAPHLADRSRALDLIGSHAAEMKSATRRSYVVRDA